MAARRAAAEGGGGGGVCDGDDAEAAALAELASESLLAAILGACAAAPVVSALRWLLRVAPASPWSATRGVKRACFGGGASTHSSALGVYIATTLDSQQLFTCIDR